MTVPTQRNLYEDEAPAWATAMNTTVADLQRTIQSLTDAFTALVDAVESLPPEVRAALATDPGSAQEEGSDAYRLLGHAINHLTADQGYPLDAIAAIINNSTIWQESFQTPVSASGLKQVAAGEVRYQAKRGKSYQVMRDSKCLAVLSLLIPLTGTKFHPIPPGTGNALARADEIRERDL